jgi:alpha-mannosidase
MLQTWKPAEDGNGSILRFVDLGGAERAVTVRTPFVHLAQVWQTDAVERGQTALPVEGHNQFRFNIQPHEIVTVRVVEANK